MIKCVCWGGASDFFFFSFFTNNLYTLLKKKARIKRVCVCACRVEKKKNRVTF